MHVYIYDDYLSRGKYSRAINRVEIRLTDLGLNGKIIRLGGLKNIKNTIQNEVKLGAKTIVAVGNNQTLNRIIGAVIEADAYGDFQKKTVIGVIPIGSDNSIATSFGITDEEEACNIILARRIEKIDLGLAGNHYFLNQATIPSQGTIIEIGDYSLESSEKGDVKIINLLNDLKEKIPSNPHDGKLEILIRARKRDESFIRAAKFRLSNPKEKLLIDGVIEMETPVNFSVIKDKLNVIVGKGRMFE